MRALPDLRDHVRGEPAPRTATIVLRGGPDTAAKIRLHAQRLRRAYSLDGGDVTGISVFGALDELGPASMEAILAQKLGSYRVIRRVTAGELIDAGFELLPTFLRPHFTLLLPDLDRAGELLALLGPEQPNPRYGQRQRPPRRRPR
ncbi:MAG: hypothetical protein ACKV2O_06585 [Acidimicrobiales bacterium]